MKALDTSQVCAACCALITASVNDTEADGATDVVGVAAGVTVGISVIPEITDPPAAAALAAVSVGFPPRRPPLCSLV